MDQSFKLFSISLLALFLELLLIRWIGTEINIFAYLQNTVLVVCFMGLALGCLTSQQPITLRNVLIPMLLLVLLLSMPITRQFLGNISLFLSTLDNPIGWNMVVTRDVRTIFLSTAAGLIATFALMLLMCQLMLPLGRMLGQLVDQHPRPILAYSINILGSLLGIWLFVLLSVVYHPPAVWFLVVALLLIYFVVIAGSERGINLVLLAGIVLLSWFAGRDPGSKETLWTPYQKLSLSETGFSVVPYYIRVNNTGFQWIVDFNAEDKRLDPDLFSEDIRDLEQYEMPMLMHPNPQTVLVVGAGTGNDVASAMSHPTVKEITAVEIDPAIIHLGRKFHPQSPYQSHIVKVINDDARSFFMTTQERYDVIVFGYLDSHTMTGMTNARLDHYVYTQESLTKAKALLPNGGILFVKFLALKPFIADRLARLLRDAFGEDPMVFRLSNGAYAPGPMLFVAGDLPAVRSRINSNPMLASWVAKWKTVTPLKLTYDTPVTTDDWPYLYLSSRYIPPLYVLMALMMVTLLFYTKWRFQVGALRGHWTLSHWHFFFLGAGFLLLEVQNISKASIVLGNTWSVNAVVISGMLVMILFANLIMWRFPQTPPALINLGLIGSCIGLYFIDLAWFGSLSYYEKLTAIGVITSVPIVFSGMIFIRSFATVIGRDLALGANLVGSMVGGLLQSVTFVTGTQALLLIVAALYCAAMVCSARVKDTQS